MKFSSLKEPNVLSFHIDKLQSVMNSKKPEGTSITIHAKFFTIP
jgi:hypothetical protein